MQANKSENTILTGPHLLLRTLTASDATDQYVAWLNDSRVNAYLETRFSAQTIETVREYVDSMIVSSHDFFFAICYRSGEKHIGNIRLGHINWHHRHAEISLFLGEKGFWGRGLATEAIEMVSDFGFQRLGLRKIIAGAYGANIGSIRAFQKAGYEIEGQIKGYYVSDKTREDRVLLGRESAMG